MLELFVGLHCRAPRIDGEIHTTPLDLLGDEHGHAAVFPLAVVLGSVATVQVSSSSIGFATTHQPLMCHRWRAMSISSRFTPKFEHPF